MEEKTEVAGVEVDNGRSIGSIRRYVLHPSQEFFHQIKEVFRACERATVDLEEIDKLYAKWMARYEKKIPGRPPFEEFEEIEEAEKKLMGAFLDDLEELGAVIKDE